jgi:hypothetical protein
VAIEQRYGTGRILYCGLTVADKIGEEPIAEVVFANILRWGFGAASPFQSPRGCFEEGSAVEGALRELGVQFQTPSGEVTDIVLGDESLLDKTRGALLAAGINEGGTIVLFHLSAEGLEPLNELLRSRWEGDVRGEAPRLELEEVDGSALRGSGGLAEHPLLAGVRPEDVQSFGPRGGDEKMLCVRAVGDEAHFSHLIGKGVVGKLERDGVRIIFWQVPLDEGDAEAKRRVLSSILTNLGVRLEPAK